MTTAGRRFGALWIGVLESYMDEAFLHNAMKIMGESGVISIKVMPPNYGFINFDSDKTAIIAMHRLRGKVIPNSDPLVRFKVNHYCTRQQPGNAEMSIWVGDLTPEVDDFALYSFFNYRYGSITYATVALDESADWLKLPIKALVLKRARPRESKVKLLRPRFAPTKI